jgi:hypothetical protein
VPLGHVIAAVAGHGRRQCNGTRNLLQRAQGDTAQAVLLVDDLALLCDPQAAVYGSRWRAEHGNVCLAAAPADRTAASMEQRKLDVLS